MKRIFFAALGLVWATASYGGDPGEGAVGQRAWGGKSPDYFLSMLPVPPGNGCPGKDDEIKPFLEKLRKARKELRDEVGKRQRALEKWNEQNSKRMMENAVDMPGFEGKSQAEMKKMSKAERKKMAEKMMQEKFGVSMEDLKAQKKANKEGKTMANVDFAKTMAGEMQVNDMMKSKGQREADKKKIVDAGKLAKEQAALSQQLSATVVGKSLTRLEELDQDKQRKGLQERIYDQEETLADMMGEPYRRPKEIDFKKMAEILRTAALERDGANVDLAKQMGFGLPEPKHEPGTWKVSCGALNEQSDVLYMQKLAYCQYTAAKYIDILQGLKSALSSALPRYRKLDQVNSDLQKAQTGIGLSDAAIGLSGLEAIQQYAALLENAYAYNPGEKRSQDDAGFCGGAEF